MAKELLVLGLSALAMILLLVGTGLVGAFQDLGETQPTLHLVIGALGLLFPLVAGLLLLRAMKARRQHANLRISQAALAEREAIFQQLVDNIDAVFWMTDPDKETNLYVSEAYETVWGRSRASLREDPMGFVDAIHPEDRQRVIEALPQQRQGTYDETYRVIQPDGTVRWVRDRAFPIEGDDGQVARVVGIAEDVTAQIEAEADLRAAEARFRAIAENLDDLLWVAQPDNTVEYLSPSFEHLFGIPRESLADGYGQLLDRIHPEDLPMLQEAADAGIGWVDWPSPWELRIVGPDGGWRWIEGRTSEVLDEHGEIRWIVGITTDITHRKEAQALREAGIQRAAEIEHLEASAEFRTRFLNRAAHELATPLTPARFHLETLAASMNGVGTQDQRDALEGLRRVLGRLSRTTELLVLATRVESGEISLSDETVDLTQLADARARTAKATYQDTGRILAVTLEEDLAVRGDEDRLENALDCLLEEARQLLSDGSGAHLDLRGEAAVVLLTLDVDEADPETVAADDEAHPGIDVDLRVVVARGLIEAHGGTLEIEPRPGANGQRFVVALPRWRGPPPTPEGAEEAPEERA